MAEKFTKYMCGYCSKGGNNGSDVLEHQVRYCNQTGRSLKLRVLTGKQYRSVSFPTSTQDAYGKFSSGRRIIWDETRQRISYKRVAEPEQEDFPSGSKHNRRDEVPTTSTSGTSRQGSSAAESTSAFYMCAYCSKSSDDAERVLHHEAVTCNQPGRTLKLRMKRLDPEDGVLRYVSVDFRRPLNDVLEMMMKGATLEFDTESMRVFLHPPLEFAADTDTFATDWKDASVDDEQLDDIHESRIRNHLSDFINRFRDRGELGSLASCFEVVASGRLPVGNISCQLFLETAKFASLLDKRQMRYTSTTLKWWLTFYKLFHGRGMRMMEGARDDMVLQECLDDDLPVFKGNFAVPSPKILQREGQRYRLAVDRPGVIVEALDSFAETRGATDVKLSFDGKKLARGFGKKLGDANMAGFEPQPTLIERKKRLEDEIKLADDAQDLVAECQVDENVTDDPDLVDITRSLICASSRRVRDLRKLVLSKRLYLDKLLLQTGPDWKDSKLASGISYTKTIIIKAQAILRKLLMTNDDLGFLASVCNGTSDFFHRGVGVRIDLEQQGNYICLRKLSPEVFNDEDPKRLAPVTKQHSDEWFSLRKGAAVTGSTFYRALGLDQLKNQKKHIIDHILNPDNVEPPDAELQKLFDWGTSNEINGMATFVGKILPVFYPAEYKFKEDGCEILPVGQNYAVISGDGTVVGADDCPQTAIEIKCPFPGKKYVTDVSYELPIRYSTQVLSQMNTKGCSKYTNVCYTPTSTTYITGDNSQQVWEEVKTMTDDMYGGDLKNIQVPTRTNKSVPKLREALKEYAKASTFVAEFPSASGKACVCCEKSTSTEMQGAFKTHSSMDKAKGLITADEASHIIDCYKENMEEAYQLLRVQAAEIFVGLMSDFDRHKETGTFKSHAIPISYHMPGRSLRTLTFKLLLDDIVKKATDRKLYPKVVSTDGQFHELSVTDLEGKASTLLQLDKEVWAKATKKKKVEQMKLLCGLNDVGTVNSIDDVTEHFFVSLHSGNSIELKLRNGRKVYSQSRPYFGALLESRQLRPNVSSSAEINSEEEEEESEVQSAILMDEDVEDPYESGNLPTDIVTEMDDEALATVQLADIAFREANQPETDSDDLPDLDSSQQVSNPQPSTATGRYSTLPDEKTDRASVEQLQDALEDMVTKKGKRCKWLDASTEMQQDMLSCGKSIGKAFTKEQLHVILNVNGHQTKKSQSKPSLVNLVSKLYGDGSELEALRHSRSSFKDLIRAELQKLPKVLTNILTAANSFEEAKWEYEERAAFPVGSPYEVIIEGSDQPPFLINEWRAQPINIGGQLVQVMIDMHHILCNNRCRVCSKGMTDMGVHARSFHKVAERECTVAKEKRTGLSVELAKELRDKQRNSFALTTFGPKVQSVLLDGDDKDKRAGLWCQLLYDMYQAVDQRGMKVYDRITKLLNMRNFLISFHKPGRFPPPGRFVAEMPIVQYEGLIANIDRRICLYSMLKAGTYNHRTPTTLDSESFFGCFQDFDPKGVGVPRADDVPLVLSSALALLDMKLDPECYFFQGTIIDRVYVDPPLCIVEPSSGSVDVGRQHLHRNRITVRSHFFDEEPIEGRRRKPKRKSGVITEYGKTAAGAQGVRPHHRHDEEKILAHRRANIPDEDVE